MAVIRDRLIDSGSGFVNDATAPVTNAFLGGQDGPILNIGRYVNNSAYVKRNVIVRVVEFPLWVNYMPDPEPYRKAIKTFFEVQSKVDGLNKALTAEFAEQEIGSAGHRQYDVSKVVEAQSDVTHTLTDKAGQPYKQLLTHWLRYGMMDPETRMPLISVLRDDIPDMMPDMYSATVLYMEPDPLHRYVQNAWLLTNMAPRGNGPDEGRKDLSAAGETSEMAIQFTSLQQTSYGVKLFAQNELDKMNRAGLNPLTRKAFVDKVDADVSGTAGGYFEVADAAAREQV